MWANTVLASNGYILAMVVYTGKETRAIMNEREPATKYGKIENELNQISKLLFLFMVILSVGIVAMNGFQGNFEL
jgi:phospholipid-translocating ATPase